MNQVDALMQTYATDPNTTTPLKGGINPCSTQTHPLGNIIFTGDKT